MLIQYFTDIPTSSNLYISYKFVTTSPAKYSSLIKHVFVILIFLNISNNHKNYFDMFIAA